VSPESLAAALKVLSSTSHVPPPTPDDSDAIAVMGDISSHDLMVALQVMSIAQVYNAGKKTIG